MSIALFFSVSLCLCGKALAEEDRYSLLGNLKDDFTYIGTSPTRMDGNSALVTLGLIGAGAVLYTEDGKIRDYVQDHHTSTLDDINPTVEKLGNGLYDLGFLVLYGGSGYLAGNDKMQETALLSFESFIVANTIGTAVKAGAGRARPYTEEGGTRFEPFSFSTDHTSFPSGHTVNAFSIASVFAEEYDNPAVDLAAYGLASAVAMQRVYDDKHWTSDVFAGAALGTIIGKGIVFLHKGKTRGNVFIIPISSPSQDMQGIMAVIRL